MMLKVERKLYYRLFFVGWFFLCSCVLASYLLSLRAGADGEIRVLFYLQILALTFPLGYFAGLLASVPFELLIKVGVTIPVAYAQIGTDFLTWLLMVAIGFLQWFVWLPKLFIRIKSIWNTKIKDPRP